MQKGGAYLQDTTVQHFILRLRLQKGGILAGHYGTTFYTEVKVAKGGGILAGHYGTTFYTEAKVAKGGGILAGHYGTTFYTEAKVAKGGGAYLQDTTVQHFILRLRLQKGGHTCRTLRYNISLHRQNT